MFLNEEKKRLEDLSEDEQLIVFKGFIGGCLESYFVDSGWISYKNSTLNMTYIYRVPPRKTKIDWSCINPNLKYFAIDNNGERWFYSEKPKISVLTWDCYNHVMTESACLLSDKVIQIGDEPWQESLIERPEGE